MKPREEWGPADELASAIQVGVWIVFLFLLTLYLWSLADSFFHQ